MVEHNMNQNTNSTMLGLETVCGGVKAQCIIVIYAFFIMYTFYCSAVFLLYFSCSRSNINCACHIDFVVCLRNKCVVTRRPGYFNLTAQFSTLCFPLSLS